MSQAQLHQTLIALLDGLEPSRHTGINVADVSIQIPLVTRVALENGQMVVLAQPAESIYQYGFEQAVNTVHIRAVDEPMQDLDIGDDDDREQ